MKICKQCQISIIETKIFCSQSCAAKFNNARRTRTTWSIKAKENLSQKMKKLYKEGKITMPKGIARSKRTKQFYKCHHCHNIFEQKNWGQKCCSIACRDSIRSKNKCAKIRIIYFNHNDNTETSLQSSWELTIAKWLDEQNIIWLRPSKRLHWFDTTMKKWRTYLPDFYLPKFNKFLDVKNPIKMKEDADKLSQLMKLFPLLLGNREEIKAFVSNLVLHEGFEPS